MTGRKNRWGGAWRPALAAAAIGARLAAADVATLREDSLALTSDPHRLAGTEAGRRAADYVESRLKQIGVDEVFVQDFVGARLRTLACDITISNATGPAVTRELVLMRPNGVVPPVTPPEGLTGPVVHAGAGSPANFGAGLPANAIVVLDYNNSRGWMEAFRLGAAAVVFVREGECDGAYSHYTMAPANLPRYLYNGPRADLPAGATATIRSAARWERAPCRNVFGLVRGTGPVFQMEKEELVVVAVPLDSYGEAPELSPGARGAANVAALLQMAEHFKRHPPRRHVLLAFLDGQARSHAGAAEFYRALDLDPAKQRESLAREKDFLSAMLEATARSEPLARDVAVRRELISRLQERALVRTYDAMARLYDLRRALAAADSATDQDILRQRIREMEERKARWNDLRRALGRAARAFAGGQDALLRADAPEMGDVLREVKAALERRREELDFEAIALASDEKVRAVLGDAQIKLHISLLLGDASPRWGLLIGGHSPIRSDKDRPGLYGRIQASFMAAAAELEKGGVKLGGFETATADGTLIPQDVLRGAPHLTHSGEIAGRLGLYNLVLGTAQEPLRREGTPDDTLDRLDLTRLEAQMHEMARLIGAVADQEGLSQPSSIQRDREYVSRLFTKDYRVEGPMVMGRTRGSTLANLPMAGAVVQIQLHNAMPGAGHQEQKIRAFDVCPVIVCDGAGSYGYGPVPPDPDHWRVNGFAAAFDERGRVAYASANASAGKVYERLAVHQCRGGAIILPPLLRQGTAQVLDAPVNAVLPDSKAFYATMDGVVAWFADERVTSVKLFGVNSAVGLVNGPEDTLRGGDAFAPEGVGFPLTDYWTVPAVTRRSAADLWRLNESRMDILRERGILNSSLEELHGRDEDMIGDAAGAPAERAQALAAFALMGEKPVYDSVRATLDDLVRAVLVLLALCIPFAFAAERLLVGSTNVYRQIAWFAGIFLATFLILFFTHPAFAISKTPVIIFLGFAVVVLSGLVIAIIMQKFEVELKVIQGLTSTVHAADVSRMSTILAAMSMGISTMRRRPLRTALTATTIILLTFTILCFASFDKRLGVVRQFVRPSPGYTGVQVRQVNWSALPAELPLIISGRWRGQGTLCVRRWVSPTTQQGEGLLLSQPDGSRPAAMRGLLGVAEEERRFRPDLAELLQPVDGVSLDETVWVTPAVAQRVGVGPGDEVMLRGVRLHVGRLLNPAMLMAIKDMDASQVLPVDFTENQNLQQQLGIPPVKGAAEQQENWTVLPADSVLVVSDRTAEQLGARVHAMTFYTANHGDATQIGEDLARALEIPVAATREDGVYRHVLDALVQASGAKDLLFPILLGGLVIFGTMLGSVADREREIYTFSALGLAPQHVAGLFFAEAMVYSVIGGMGGYLLAQAVMKALSGLAAMGLAPVPEMNYSSMNSIITILIVMGTVLVSAIYPAIKASRSANPGLLRSWRLPPPKGDVFEITFPFTVSQYDITGVVSFLREHFENHRDTGLGLFIAQDVRLARPEAGAGLEAHVALAPFDLGVTQSFRLFSRPSEIAGIDEVGIRIERQSGQPKDWQRLNKVLLDDLRRQFLIWRSLPRETMEIYRERTLAEWGGARAGEAMSGQPS